MAAFPQIDPEILSLVFDASPVGFLLADFDGRIIHANQAAQRLFGLQRDSFIGQKLATLDLHLVHEDGAPFPIEDFPLIKTLSAGRPVTGVVIGVSNPITDVTWVAVTAAPIAQTSANHQAMVVVTLENITPRIQSQKELHALKSQYVSALEGIDSAITVLDYNGRYLFMNDWAAQLLGSRPGDLIGKNIHDVFPASTAARQLEVIRKVIISGEGLVVENQVPVANGLRWFRISVQPVRDEKDQVTYVVTNSIDIDDLQGARRTLLELNYLLEDRVRERTAEVQDLYENAPCGYHSLDAAGTIVRINQTELNWLGYTKEEMLGRPIADFATPASQEMLATKFPEFKQRGWLRDLQFEFVRKDGSILPALVNATAIFDANGAYVMSRSSVFDNTQRKQAEDALRQSEKTFQQAFEAGPVARSIRRMSDGVFIEVNPSFLELFDFTRDQVIGHSPAELNQEAPLNGASEYIQMLRDLGRVENLEMALVSSADRPIQALVSAVIVNINGEDHSISSWVDLTSHRQAEQALKLAVGSGKIGLWDWNLIANEIYFSPEFKLLLGYQDAEFPNEFSEWERRLHPADHDRVTAVLMAFTHRPEAIKNIEFRLRHKSGAYRWFLSQASLTYAESGRPIHMLGSIIDIDDLKQTQLRLEQQTLELSQANAELYRASQAKDEFMAMVSHELRTPLTPILGLSEALVEGVYGEVTPVQQARLTTIHDSGQHLLTVINDILDFSKLASGHFELNPWSVEVASVCKSAVQTIKIQAAKKEIKLTFEIDRGIDLITVDQRRLRQLLLNLLSNAIKFTPTGGKVGLEVSRESADVLRFAVWDTGIGIASEDIPRLFEPFTQLNSTLNRQYNGTGLGLALVQRLTQQMGGSIGVESEVGKGSRFWFTLPLVQPGAAAAPEKTPPAPAAEPAQPSPEALAGELSSPPVSQACILFAEDNLPTLKLISEYLRTKDYRVIAAADGQEAIRRALEFKPDLILMDTQMPILDGLEATRQLRALPEFAATPIIALTALVMPGDREKCLQAGATEYIPKPVDLRNLVKIITEYLQSKP